MIKSQPSFSRLESEINRLLKPISACIYEHITIDKVGRYVIMFQAAYEDVVKAAAFVGFTTIHQVLSPLKKKEKEQFERNAKKAIEKLPCVEEENGFFYSLLIVDSYGNIVNVKK